MPQFTIKLNTYDPAIVEAFKRLRKSRKQTAFTHEAIKYFLSSERGMRVMELMDGVSTQSQISTRDSAHAEPTKDCIHAGRIVVSSASTGLPGDYLSNVVDKILK